MTPIWKQHYWCQNHSYFNYFLWSVIQQDAIHKIIHTKFNLYLFPSMAIHHNIYVQYIWVGVCACVYMFVHVYNVMVYVFMWCYCVSVCTGVLFPDEPFICASRRSPGCCCPHILGCGTCSAVTKERVPWRWPMARNCNNPWSSTQETASWPWALLMSVEKGRMTQSKVCTQVHGQTLLGDSVAVPGARGSDYCGSPDGRDSQHHLALTYLRQSILADDHTWYTYKLSFAATHAHTTGPCHPLAKVPLF